MKRNELEVAMIAATIIGNASGDMDIALKVREFRKKCENEEEAIKIASNLPSAVRKYQEKLSELRQDPKALEKYKSEHPDMEKKIDNHRKNLKKIQEEEVSFKFEKFKLSEVKEFNLEPHFTGVTFANRQIGLVDFLDMANSIIDFDN